jgi:hypothetical protein
MHLIMYEFNRNKKNQFENILAHFKIFWIQKLTLRVSFQAQKLRECVSLWAQKLTLWAIL